MRLGPVILLGLAAIQVIVTPIYDLNSRHLYNASWPAHARFHCVAYTLLNMGMGIASAYLVLQGSTLGLRVGAAMLGWSALLQFIAALFPGVTPTADGEKVWRGWPVSLWGSALYLILVITGALV